MKIKEIMREPAAFCTPEMDLRQAALLMQQHACGCLPVVGEGGNVIGLLTDRDICMALGSRDRSASEVLVREVAPLKLFTCTPENDIHCALKTIRWQRVRRLPVVDPEGALKGILSMDDVVLHAKKDAGRRDISFDDVIDAYQAIAHQPAGCAR